MSAVGRATLEYHVLPVVLCGLPRAIARRAQGVRSALSAAPRPALHISDELMRAKQISRSWRDARSVSLLGMGTALPGPPVSTLELLGRLQSRFGVDVRRQGTV